MSEKQIRAFWMIITAEIILLLLLYGAFAFVFMEVNPFEWKQNARFAMMTLYFLFSIPIGMMADLFADD